MCFPYMCEFSIYFLFLYFLFCGTILYSIYRFCDCITYLLCTYWLYAICILIGMTWFDDWMNWMVDWCIYLKFSILVYLERGTNDWTILLFYFLFHLSFLSYLIVGIRHTNIYKWKLSFNFIDWLHFFSSYDLTVFLCLCAQVCIRFEKQRWIGFGWVENKSIKIQIQHWHDK